MRPHERSRLKTCVAVVTNGLIVTMATVTTTTLAVYFDTIVKFIIYITA